MSTNYYAIALVPVVPLRTEPSEAAEQESQILFGEMVCVAAEQERWLRVMSLIDGAEGWVDRKMLTPVSTEYRHALDDTPLFLTRQPITDLHERGTKRVLRLSMGSRLPGYNPATSTFTLCGRTFSVKRQDVVMVGEGAFLRQLLRTAELFLGTPYLWGGRHIFGIDCSGLTQLVYRINGIRLPRNARQQALAGVPVARFEDAYPGDLAFFANDEGRITHVGIVMTPDAILHASGSVRIDRLTPEGIWRDDTQSYSHRRLTLRRLPQVRRRPPKQGQ